MGLESGARVGMWLLDWRGFHGKGLLFSLYSGEDEIGFQGNGDAKMASGHHDLLGDDSRFILRRLGHTDGRAVQSASHLQRDRRRRL